MREDIVIASLIPGDLSEKRLGFGRRSAITDRKEGVPSFPERLYATIACREHERVCAPEEEGRTLHIGVRRQLECLLILRGCNREAVEREGSVAGVAQRQPGVLAQLGVVPTGGADELERG